MRIHHLARAAAACAIVAAATAGCEASAGRTTSTLAAGPAAKPATQSATEPGTVTAHPEPHRHWRKPAAPPVPRTRPREQLDESNSQLNALYAPYYQCLSQHQSAALVREYRARHIHTEAWKMVGPAGLRACLPYKPLPPWQYDPANPKALGFVEQVVACLHRHGVLYAQVTDSRSSSAIGIALGGAQNDQRSVSLGLQDIPICDQEVLQAQGG